LDDETKIGKKRKKSATEKVRQVSFQGKTPEKNDVW
jgi:hypothetical protein